jgi:hypothetical protein
VGDIRRIESGMKLSAATVQHLVKSRKWSSSRDFDAGAVGLNF